MQNYEQRRNELVQSIDRDRHQVSEAMDDLKAVARQQAIEVRHKVSLRHQLLRHPVIWLLGGLLLGSLLGWRRQRHHEYHH